ncbi:hypothetical protein PC129_g2425 [Phytophthora cactorum]|uniref:Uncharacterized protein n=1 Tax=Phytophthora cactorum TaxID=29920 RepID=A0A329T345_9STRA|nr:hypothetical protein Pcac1_g3890 [Phytophthora cactorum]KAG2839854.1 hypothetical protein PC112_g3968 [Phytophthora cactorum]KAG2841833.1 hypothetical protein PC111_g2971 [Phytophthora cactorum]KAG2865055.1 hypothetical protein PC113_g4046 [Phytophthora cactorum]KAG2924468.1 hypothetical protein PC114_g4472 [Phytophthora cactorum]
MSGCHWNFLCLWAAKTHGRHWVNRGLDEGGGIPAVETDAGAEMSINRDVVMSESRGSDEETKREEISAHTSEAGLGSLARPHPTVPVRMVRRGSTTVGLSLMQATMILVTSIPPLHQPRKKISRLKVLRLTRIRMKGSAQQSDDVSLIGQDHTVSIQNVKRSHERRGNAFVMVVGSGVSEKDARNLHIMEVSAGRMVEKRAAIIQDVRRLCNRRGNAFFMVVESGAREKDAQNPHSTVCAKRMVERNHARILGVPNKPS